MAYASVSERADRCDCGVTTAFKVHNDGWGPANEWASGKCRACGKDLFSEKSVSSGRCTTNRRATTVPRPPTDAEPFANLHLPYML